MSEVIKTFKQEEWNPQLDVSIHVSIHKGGMVSVDGVPTSTQREHALAHIILRLNAFGMLWKERVEQLQKELKELDSKH